MTVDDNYHDQLNDDDVCEHLHQFINDTHIVESFQWFLYHILPMV